MKNDATLKTDVDASIKAEFDAFRKDVGQNQREAVERLLEWFNGQEPAVKGCILRSYPEQEAPDIARMVLERMATGSGGGEAAGHPGEGAQAMNRASGATRQRRQAKSRPKKA